MEGGGGFSSLRPTQTTGQATSLGQIATGLRSLDQHQQKRSVVQLQKRWKARRQIAARERVLDRRERRRELRGERGVEW